MREKARLLRQAFRLYTLGMTADRRREKRRRYVDEKLPYDAPRIGKAVAEYESANKEWRRLKREHLAFLRRLKAGGDADA
jgi:hypothetical protein